MMYFGLRKAQASLMECLVHYEQVISMEKQKPLALLFALFLLSCLFFPSVSAAFDDDDDDDDDGGDDDNELGEDLGNISQILLIATISLVAWKPAHIWVRKTGLEKYGNKFAITDHKAFKKKLTKINKWMSIFHLWVGVGAVVTGLVHGLMTEGVKLESSLVWLGWLGMLFMSILGGLMQWKWPPKKVRKGARLLHSQRIILVLTIILLVIGHEMM